MILVQQVFSYVLSAYGFRLLYCLLLYTTRCTTPAQERDWAILKVAAEELHFLQHL